MTRDEAIKSLENDSHIAHSAKWLVDSMIKLGVLKVTPEPPAYIKVAMPSSDMSRPAHVQLWLRDIQDGLMKSGYAGELYFDPHGLRERK
jgi:hypothetical protein